MDARDHRGSPEATAGEPSARLLPGRGREDDLKPIGTCPVTTILLAVTVSAGPAAAQETRTLDEFAPLIGRWQASLDPEVADHPAVRRFNPNNNPQQLVFRWGAERKVVHLRAVYVDRPTPGDTATYIEGIAVREPASGVIRFLSSNVLDDQHYEGTMRFLDDGTVERTYTASFAGDRPEAQFRERWEWTSPERVSFRWHTARIVDGDTLPSDIIPRYDRQPADLDPTVSAASSADGTLEKWKAHLESLADGVWTTSNEAYHEADGGITDYGMAYQLDPGGLAGTGCLWSERNGEVEGVAWHFLLGWDPVRGAGLVYQSHPAGLVATGYWKPRGASTPVLVQDLWSPDGTVSRTGHFERLEDGVRVTRSVVFVEGEWQDRRTYRWVRGERPATPCG